MESFVIVDQDERRRTALKAILEPENEVTEWPTLQPVEALAKGRKFSGLILPWMTGGKEGLMAVRKVGWTSDYVLPVLLLPRELSPDQVEAETQQAVDWAKQTFPQAQVKCVPHFSVPDILLAVSEIRGEPSLTVQNAPTEGFGIQEAQQLLGRYVQVQKKIDQGSTSSVFIVTNSMGNRRAYKLARSGRAAQFEAVRKAIELIWSTNKGAEYLLHADADYCQDRRFYYVAASLLDNVAGNNWNPNTYRPKTLFSWLGLLQRCNGSLGKSDALKFIRYLVSALKGLSFLHDNGLAYNDVHPGNCGFFENRPVWMDYSAITFLGEEPHEGAAWYAAPEGREATAAHDCFSLVKILVQGLSDLHAATIQPTVIAEISEKHFTGVFGEIIRSIACKGLSMHPTQRYQSASDLIRDLQNAKQLLANDMA